jgi:hypothetical protein
MLRLVMQLTSYELALLIGSVLLQAAIVWRIWTAGLLSEYPAMFRFCTANGLSSIAMIIAAYTATEQMYCYMYWFTNIVCDTLALAVTLEIFRDIFKPYEALRHFGTVMFRWIVAVMVLVSVVSAVSTGSVHTAVLINSINMMFDRGLEILQCGIVLFLLLTNQYLGISYRQRVFGIATGFGLVAAATLIMLSVMHWVPTEMIRPLSSVMSVSMLTGQGIWLVYFYLPQPERRISEAMPESRRWEYALASLHSPAEGLFLTSIDRTVERLLTKNNVNTQQKPKEEKHWFGD